MPPLINNTYFINEITIAQINQPDVVEQVDDLIAKYENVFLRDVLGYSFTKLMLANIADARFVALLNGAEFTNVWTTYLDKWDGLANSITKHSPIANYVFYKYVRAKHEQQGGISTLRPKAENADVVTAEYTLIKAYNEMVDMIHKCRQYLISEKVTYPEFDMNQVKEFTHINHYF